MAERQGFEPWIPCGIHAFQACAFSHSAISPQYRGLLESITSHPAKFAIDLSRKCAEDQFVAHRRFIESLLCLVGEARHRFDSQCPG